MIKKFWKSAAIRAARTMAQAALALIPAAAGIGSDPNRIKYRNGSTHYWWLRSPHAGFASRMHNITGTGNISTSNADLGYWVSPGLLYHLKSKIAPLGA